MSELNSTIEEVGNDDLPITPPKIKCSNSNNVLARPTKSPASSNEQLIIDRMGEPIEPIIMDSLDNASVEVQHHAEDGDGSGIDTLYYVDRTRRVGGRKIVVVCLH